MNFFLENAFGGGDFIPPETNNEVILDSALDTIDGGIGLLVIIIVGLVIVYFTVVRPLRRRRVESKNISNSGSKTTHSNQLNNSTNQAVNTVKGKIFLSYRRSDSADVSGRVYDRLITRFGDDSVFKDVDSIPLGKDFRESIDSMIKKSSIVLVMIGNDWLGNKNDPNKRRIDDPKDFVRLETAISLKRNANIIPVLVRNAQIPSEGDLPEELKPLAYRHGISIRPDPDFNNDINKLMTGIEEILSSENSLS